MSRKPTNDVPPKALNNEEDDETVSIESGSDVEFDLDAHPGSVKRGAEKGKNAAVRGVDKAKDAASRGAEKVRDTTDRAAEKVKDA